MPTVHIPVMPSEVVEGLALRPGAIVVDGTLGGGGHTRRLAEAVGPEGLVLAFDRDPAALAAAEQELAGRPVKLVHANFCDLPEVLQQVHIPRVDGVLLDLGLSTDQLADVERGFSFTSSGRLDLRFDPARGESAADLVARLSAEELANVIYDYGEERFSRRIARRIVERRRQQPIRSASQLAEIVRSCVPRSKNHSIDPATRTFQALRIAVNRELESLELALERIPDCLVDAGRLAIISFHSLEDRRVKQAFRADERLEPLTKKPLRPSEVEVAANPASRSAKLRIAARR